MMEKFTKGGWSLSESNSGDFDVYSEDDHPTHVAFVPAWDAGDEAQFNAALIAAAPEMYEMLKVLLPQIAGSPAALKVNRLLAKARGEQ